ncbi:MAG: TVP38/TMEM64 family protein [Pseudomonadota bacterium]
MAMDETLNSVEKTEAKARGSWKRFLPLAVIATLLGAGYAAGLHTYLSPSAIADNKEAIDAFVSANFLTAVAAYLVIYIIAVSLSFPGAGFLTIAGGAVFGWFVAGTLTIVAATIGASVIFLAAKTSIGDYLAEKAGPRMTKLREGFQQDAFNYLLTLRLAPVVPFWITNLAPAVFGMDLPRYALATFIGIIPGTYAFAFMGEQLGGAVEGADIITKITLGLAALAAVSIIPIVVKFVRRRKMAKTQA